MKSVLFITILLFIHVKCAKILGVFPAPGYSQFILAEVLMKELANRGHQVTVISAYSPKDALENYKTIEIRDVLAVHDDLDDLFQLEGENLFTSIMTTYQYGNGITETTLKDKKVQNLLRSDESFDLVIVEQFFNDALKGFATHFNAPLVLFSSMGVTEWNKHVMGNPALPSINVLSYASYANHMNFFQRFQNLYGTIFDYLYFNWIVYPLQKEYLKYFPKPMDFDQVICNASLMLLNSHVTTSENSLLPYNMIEIGGYHIVDEPLDQEIQQFLDGAKGGAILFSMGSNLNSSNLPPETLNGIFKVFGELKQKILWKFEKDLPNKPNNILISKWLKQSDILAHPNVQAFITHGGLLSTTEAVFHGVPMIGIPIFGDQKRNMARASRNGIAKVVPYQELSEQSLGAAIKEVLNNDKYHYNARKLSNLIRDRVVRPLDLAMYWIEYVIRHKGMRFEPPSLHMRWFQIYMVDCIMLVLSIPLSVILLKAMFLILVKQNKSNIVQSKFNAKKNKNKQH